MQSENEVLILLNNSLEKRFLNQTITVLDQNHF